MPAAAGGRGPCGLEQHVCPLTRDASLLVGLEVGGGRGSAWGSKKGREQARLPAQEAQSQWEGAAIYHCLTTCTLTLGSGSSGRGDCSLASNTSRSVMVKSLACKLPSHWAPPHCSWPSPQHPPSPSCCLAMSATAAATVIQRLFILLPQLAGSNCLGERGMMGPTAQPLGLAATEVL